MEKVYDVKVLDKLAKLRNKALHGKYSERGLYMSQYLTELKNHDAKARDVLAYLQQKEAAESGESQTSS